MRKFGNIIWGLILIVLGIIVGCNALDITNINLFFDGWWTLFIIVPSFMGLFNEKDKTASIIFLLIGIALLLCCQKILDFSMLWKLALPIILVIVGVSFVFKDTINSEVNEKVKELNKSLNKDNEYAATFSSQDLKFDGEKFDGAEFTAVFGGVKCNLTNAIIEKDVVINATSIFGGIDIIVPNSVKVKVKSNSIFGGVDNKIKGTTEDAPTIYVNASCIFGGVDIK